MMNQEEITELIDLEMNPPPAPTIEDHLKTVSLTQKELDKIKDNLNQMVDTLAQNLSYVSRASAFWGERPLWLKILIGIILIVPAFAIAIALQVYILLAITIVIAIVYTVASLLLDNHHTLNVNRTENLKTGLNSLADTLGAIILSLARLQEQLAQQIKLFQLENEKLTHHVEELHDEIQVLIEQRKLLQETERLLQESNKELQGLVGTLNTSVQEHSELLSHNKQHLKDVQDQFVATQLELQEKIGDLTQANEDLKKRINNLGDLTSALQGVITTFSNQLQLNEDQQLLFKKKLEDFLNDKEQSFHSIAERICEAEARLSIQQKLYKELNTQHENLIRSGEYQIRRLEHIQHLPQTPEAIKEESYLNAHTLRTIGFYPVAPSNDAENKALEISNFLSQP